MAKANCFNIANVALLSSLVLLSCSYTATAGFITDSKWGSKPRDLSRSVGETISKECASQGIVLPEGALESYSSCFKNIRAPFSYSIKEDLKDAVPGIQALADEIFGRWCPYWSTRTKCVRENIHHIDICLRAEKDILMDLTLAFGDALCSEDGGELFVANMQFIEYGGMGCLSRKTEGIMTCINPPNVPHFNRNLFLVTDCIVKQLSHCSSAQPMKVFKKLLEFSTGLYISTPETPRLYKSTSDAPRLNKSPSEAPRLNMDFNYGDDNDHKNAGAVYTHVYIEVAIGICLLLTL